MNSKYKFIGKEEDLARFGYSKDYNSIYWHIKKEYSTINIYASSQRIFIYTHGFTTSLEEYNLLHELIEAGLVIMLNNEELREQQINEYINEKSNCENAITCPYCGYEFMDSWEFNDCINERIECQECGKEFDLEVETKIEYNAIPIKEEVEKILDKILIEQEMEENND